MPTKHGPLPVREGVTSNASDGRGVHNIAVMFRLRYFVANAPRAALRKSELRAGQHDEWNDTPSVTARTAVTAPPRGGAKDLFALSSLYTPFRFPVHRQSLF